MARPTNNKPRPRGAVTKTFLEAQNFAKEIVDDPTYRASLKERALKGALPQSIENLLLYYRFGRPVEAIEVDVKSLVNDDLTSLSDEQLEARALAIGAAIRKNQVPAKGVH